MDRLRGLVVAGALLAACGSANALYAQLRPPPGWVAGTAAKPAAYVAQGEAAWVGNVTTVKASLGMAGAAASVPAQLELGLAAVGVLAGMVVTTGGGALAVAAATWVAAAGLQWIADQGWVTPDSTSVVSDGREYRAVGDKGPWHGSASSACQARVVAAGGDRWQLATGGSVCQGWRGPDYIVAEGIQSQGSSCPAGWYYTSSGACVQTREYTKQSADEAAGLLRGVPMPQGVPNEVGRGKPLPVGDPVINPEKSPQPGQKPKPQPMVVPQGNPVKNPKYKPDEPATKANPPYLQPVIRIVPSPTATDPWRVDIQPEDRPVMDPSSGIEEGTDQPGDDEGAKPPDQFDLCKEHPDILACQTMGDAQPDDLPHKEVPITFTPAGGFGPSDAACPASRQISVLGQTVEWSYEPICSFLHGVRPIVIGLGFLIGAYLFMGAIRGKT